VGNEVWSCLAEQFAMIPKIQIYDILILQFCSFSRPDNKWGSSSLIEKELIFVTKICTTDLAKFLIY
jgi:hypothetical protein